MIGLYILCALLLTIWFITAFRWWPRDRGLQPLRLRLWRAVNWLPLTLWYGLLDRIGR